MNKPSVVTVAGGTLFRLAMIHLGDATQWDRIAGLNGLDDPVLTGLVTLRLPPPRSRTDVPRG